ncbi:MAG: hypothetical protein WC323_00365 [Patescibacteria group bacterium]|jgi:hypothetical protein
MYYKISRLVLTPTSGKPSTVGEVFISNPQIDQEALLGKLFFLGEIESPKPSALKIMNFFINSLPNNYYQNEKISLREKMGTIKISEIFESTLAKTNAEFENFLKKEKIKINPKSLNIIAGVIYKNDLIFSAAGKTKALLVYNEKDQKDEAGSNDQLKKIYKITNVDTAKDDENKKIQLNKIFSSVTEGKIPPEGYFIFSNEILPEYISNKHLTKIITTLPPISAIEHLKTQLHKINSYITFLALIIKSSTSPQVKRSIPKMQLNVTANNSLERMNETENETEKYLSPVGIINSSRYLGIIKKISAKFYTPKNKNFTAIIRDKILFTKKHRLNLITRFGCHLKNFFIYLLSIINYLFNLLKDPGTLYLKLVKTSKKIYTTSMISILNFFRWFIKLPVLSKILLIVFLISLSLFIYSIQRSTLEKNSQLAQQNYQELTQLVTQKQNQVESALLYRNEDRAYELLEEISAIMKELEQLENADKNLINKFLETNRGQVEKISHVVAVDPGEELANFTQLNGNASVKNIFIAGNSIIASDPTNNHLYEFNRGDKTAGLMEKEAQYLDYGANFNNGVIFLSKGGRVEIDENLNINQNESAISEDSYEITDISVYNSRTYVLSAAKNNVFRYARNFSSSEAWIKEDLDIRDAISLDIDGYIYILKSGGGVIKLLSGYADNFELSPVNPPLSNASRLKLSGENEGDYLYILEPSNKRLVVFDKEGGFILQYKIEKFNNLKDFIVLGAEKKIIFLDGNAIYEVGAEHL